MWRVYYDDGSSFSSEDGPPEQAPRSGVQLIAVSDINCGKLLWHGSDYYCWQEGEWVPRCDMGLQDYLDQPGAEKIRLRGRGISHSRFLSIYRAAVDDPRMGPKTAKDSREREPI